jgi:hypothetical protein
MSFDCLFIMANPLVSGALDETVKYVEAMVQNFHEHLDALCQDMSPIAAPAPTHTPLAPNQREGYHMFCSLHDIAVVTHDDDLSPRSLDLIDP